MFAWCNILKTGCRALISGMMLASLAIRTFGQEILLPVYGDAYNPKVQDELHFDPYMWEKLPANAPEWMKEIEIEPAGVNFHQMQRLFNEWRAQNVDVRVKTLEHKQVVNFFRRWTSAYRPYAQSDGTILLPTMKEYQAKVDSMNSRTAMVKAHTKQAQAPEEPVWRNIGPNRTYVNDRGSLRRKDSQVCVFRIAVALTDSATLYCGTETGVVFKTTDHGMTWTPCAPQHAFGGSICSIAIDPKDKNTVYVGGGPWLWKSTDGGDSWSRCEGIASRVNSIRIDPNDSNFITAACGAKDNDRNSNGFFISSNGGASFSCTLRGICFDHELQPGNSSRIYVVRREERGVWTDIYVSDNMGMSWTKKELPVSFMICGRLAVSEAPEGQDYVYALVTCNQYGYDRGPFGGKGEPYILLSKDAGETWEDKTLPVTPGKYSTFSPFLDTDGGQGFFDMMVGASPQNPAHVLFGLCSLYRSTEEGKCNYRDGGIGGYQRSDWMHCDIQDIAIHPCGDTWICNDGGIKYSRDFFETKGEDRYDGIYASDYQGLGVGWNEDVMAAGRWHNGDVVHAANYGKGNSVHVGGVEIATGYVMRSNPWKVYFSDASTRIMPREMDGTIEEHYGPWFTGVKPYEALRINGEIATDPRYALRVFLQDMTNPQEGYISYDEGASFQKVFDSDGEEFYSYEFARTNPNRVYISGTWNIWRSDNGGESFTECASRPLPQLDGNMHFTRLTVDPNNEDHVIYICHDLPGWVSETFDGGTTWAPFDLGSLSNKRIHQIILVGDEYNSCYVTTYDGASVYFKDNTMTDFIDYSSGLNPGARITKVVPFYKDAVLRMATDQGLWEAPLYHQNFLPVPQPMALNLGSGDLTANPRKEVQFDSYSIVRQDEYTKWHWTFSPQPQYVSDANIRNPRVVFGNAGKYDVTLTVTTPSGTSSRTIKNMITINPSTGIDESHVGEVGLQKNVLDQGENLVVAITGLDSDSKLTIHDLKGRLMHSVHVPVSQTKLDVSLNHLTSGMYIYHITNVRQKFFGQFCIR